MTKFTKELIENYADKLLIGLTETETKNLLDEFEVIEENMNLICEIDGIKDVEPQHYPFIIESTPRDGKQVINDDIKDILKNSDKVSDREIEVPKVVG